MQHCASQKLVVGMVDVEKPGTVSLEVDPVQPSWLNVEDRAEIYIINAKMI